MKSQKIEWALNSTLNPVQRVVRLSQPDPVTAPFDPLDYYTVDIQSPNGNRVRTMSLRELRELILKNPTPT